MKTWWQDRCMRPFLDAIARVERDSAQHTSDTASQPDWAVVGLIVLVCFILSLMEYYGGSNDWRWVAEAAGLISQPWHDAIQAFYTDRTWGRLARLSYWSLCTFVGYALLPALYVRFVMRMSLSEIGLSARGALSHAWIYAVLLIIVMPAVWAVSLTPSFQQTYPFYGQAHRSPTDFLAWQALYALQFFSLEFFYRGVLIHGLKARFGFYAILLSVIPYCMIHFGKPLPETLGAVLAGLALGALALFTRSIWLGVAIHVSVAVAMDVLSMSAKGQL